PPRPHHSPLTPYTTLFRSLTHARRIKHKGLRTGLTVAMAGAAIALPATAAVAMPTDYTKEVKVDNGDTLKLDGFGKKVSISDPEDRKSTRLNSSHQIISYA